MKIKMRMVKIFLLAIFCFVGLIMGQGHGDMFTIVTETGYQGYAQVEYFANTDVYLAVWEDNRSDGGADIYGQLIKGDGTLIGDNFAICNAANDQWWPHIGVDPIHNRFLVVFEDNRNGLTQGDISGVFVNSDGSFYDAPTDRGGHSFGICTESHDIYTCSVAFNYLEGIYLVVWGDNRALGDVSDEQWGVDIYGQLVSADGSLVSPSDPTENIAIDNADWYDASVPDVTYNAITNEFFVVYGVSFSNGGQVLGQRVSHEGQLIQPDGTIVLSKTNKINSLLPAMEISGLVDGNPDGFQVKACSLTEYQVGQLAKATGATQTEVQTVWAAKNIANEDGWGQRIGFFWEVDKYVAKYIDVNGTVTEGKSNFLVSAQPDNIGILDLAYSKYDNEYLVAWHDFRNGGWVNPDLYAQRLWINGDNAMIFLADDRENTVTSSENIPIATSNLREGGILGVAHNPNVNEFLCAFEYGDNGLENGMDISGILFYGTEPPPVGVDSHSTQNPDGFVLQGNYPNPFNPTTTIAFNLNRFSHVQIQVVDLNGEIVAMVTDQMMNAGSHQVQWNGKDNSGFEAASGVYLYQIRAGQQIASAKMMLIR